LISGKKGKGYQRKFRGLEGDLEVLSESPNLNSSDSLKCAEMERRRGGRSKRERMLIRMGKKIRGKGTEKEWCDGRISEI